MSEQDRDGRFSLWTVLTVAATVAVAAASGSWYVSRALLGDELEQYRRSSEWELPETLRALGEVSERTRLDLQERARLDELKSEAESNRTKLEELNRQVSTLAENNERLANRLLDLEGDTFTLAAGEGRKIAPGLALGLRAASTVDNEAEVQFGDRLFRDLPPGTSLRETIDGKVYIITLLKVSYDQCTFAVTVEPTSSS